MFLVGVFGEGASSVPLGHENVQPASLRLVGEGMLEAAAAGGVAKLVSPSVLIGLLGVGTEGRREAKKFASKWETNVGGEPPPILEVEQKDAATASNWVAERLLHRLGALVADNQALRRQLSAIRLDYETVQRAAHRMESYIVGLRAEPFLGVFTCPYARAAQAITPEAPSIRQLVPTAPFGFAGFDLYIDLRKSDAVALFEVALRGRETERVYGSWTISASALKEGWSTFTLGRGIDADSDTLEITIELKAGRALAIGLGPKHPIADCAVYVEGPARDVEMRPLALRVWQGLPGVPPPALAGFMPANGASTRKFRLPQRSLASAIALGADGKPRPDGGDCLRTDESGAVWVQPSGDGTAVILLENACPENAVRVWATFAGASETIDCVQTAVGAVRIDGAARSVAGRDLEQLVWTDVPFNRTQTLAAEVSGRDAEVANSVLLGVRVDDPAKSWFAATRLVAVEIEYGPDGKSASLVGKS